VAVLALSNLSGDVRNDHLCEGVSADIIFNLSRFRSLAVIARHSAFLFRAGATPAEEVQRRLGARYILTGSLRRSERRLRIAVELIDATSETVVWSDRFNVVLEDLFDVQDEIAASVAARLSVQLEIAERRQESAYPKDMRAHGLLVRGNHLLLQFTKEGNTHARRLFEEALDYAPQYSRAYSAMSRTHNLDWRYSWSAEPEGSLETAAGLARRATELDPLDARGFAELGYTRLYQRQARESLKEYEQALALNPNDSDIIAEYADALVYDDQSSRSVDLLEKAMRLNPYHPDWYL
jgi:TolB-like protein